MIKNHIKGLVAASFTPMNDDFSLNLKRVSAYAEKLKKDRLAGVFVCGTTGEGLLLTIEERQHMAEEWISFQSDAFKVIVHVGSTSFKQAFELARHAQRNGAYAIASMGPPFLAPTRVNELVEFCGEVACGAAELPFYYYHIPSISGANIDMHDFIQYAKDHIPNFVGVKFTSSNLMDLQQCLELDNGGWDVLYGYDETLLAGLALGIKGAVGSTYNFMAPVYHRIINDFERGKLDSAREMQGMSVRIVEIMNKYGGAIAAGKALMKSVGVDCGPCRLPIKNLGGSYKHFLREVEGTRFFDQLP